MELFFSFFPIFVWIVYTAWTLFYGNVFIPQPDKINLIPNLANDELRIEMAVADSQVEQAVEKEEVDKSAANPLDFLFKDGREMILYRPLEEQARFGALMTSPQEVMASLVSRKPVYFTVPRVFFNHLNQMLRNEDAWMEGLNQVRFNVDSPGTIVRVDKPRITRKAFLDMIRLLNALRALFVSEDPENNQMVRVTFDSDLLRNIQQGLDLGQDIQKDPVAIDFASLLKDLLAAIQAGQQQPQILALFQDVTIVGNFFEKKVDVDVDADAGENGMRQFIGSFIDIMSKLLNSYKKGDETFEFISPNENIFISLAILSKKEYFQRFFEEALKFVESKDNALGLANTGRLSSEGVYEKAIEFLIDSINKGVIEITEAGRDSLKVKINFNLLRDDDVSVGDGKVETASEAEEEVVPKPKNADIGSSEESEEEVIEIPSAPIVTASEKPPRNSVSASASFSSLLLAGCIFVLLL